MAHDFNLPITNTGYSISFGSCYRTATFYFRSVLIPMMVKKNP
jgi:hypothetical protein